MVRVSTLTIQTQLLVPNYQINVYYSLKLTGVIYSFIHANLVNFEVYLKVPISLDKMVKV